MPTTASKWLWVLLFVAVIANAAWMTRASNRAVRRDEERWRRVAARREQDRRAWRDFFHGRGWRQ